MNRIVVIGSGLSGLRTVEGLRQHGYAGEVVLLGGESAHAYDRPPLSKAVLRHGTARPYLRGPDQYDELGIDLRLAAPAVALDPAAHQIVLHDGEHIDYDAAVLATGASARNLPFVAGPTVHTLRTFADAERLRAAIIEHGEVAVIGAGFLGCEVAATARALNAKVTLIETLSTPLERVLGARVGAEIAGLHRLHGVEVRAGVGVTDFGTDGGRGVISLDDGSVVESAVVLVAIGAVPDLAWLVGSGLAGTGVERSDGVQCDEYGRTSAEDVWAVGDVSAWWDRRTDRHRRLEHWTNAVDQAQSVAVNLLAGSGNLRLGEQVHYFWSDQYDVKIQSLGDPDPADDLELLRAGPKQRLLGIYSKAGAVTAVAGLGLPRHVMRSRAAIAAAAPVAEVLALLLEG